MKSEKRSKKNAAENLRKRDRPLSRIDPPSDSAPKAANCPDISPISGSIGEAGRGQRSEWNDRESLSERYFKTLSGTEAAFKRSHVTWLV
jgi:hypothetical protein